MYRGLNEILRCIHASGCIYDDGKAIHVNHSTIKGLVCLSALSLLTFGATTGAKAQFLGSTLSWQYYFSGGPFGGSTTFVDNGGSGGNFSGFFDIIADDTSVTFNYSGFTGGSNSWNSSGLSLAPTIFNGIAVNVVSGPAITSLTIDPSTNMVGFNSSLISFTGNQIQVDWQGLAFNNATLVKLNLTGARTNATPEPGIIALLAGAVVTGGGFLLGRRRRLSK